MRNLTIAGLALVLATSGIQEIRAIDASPALPTTPSSTDDAALSDIISKLKESEQLFRNLDVTIDYDYENSAVKPGDSAPRDGAPILFSKQTAVIRNVTQGRMFRVDRTGAVQTTNGEFSLDRIRACDVWKTRTIDQGIKLSDKDGRVGDPILVAPHMQLLRFMQFQAPLSVYLSGDKAMTAFPAATWNPSYKLDVAYQGEETIEGLRCCKVWITTIIDGSPYDRWELWLVRERNFFPCKIVGRTFKWSEAVPVSAGTASDWREVEPGVWYPYKTEFIGFDKQRVAESGVQMPSWTERTTTTKIKLRPALPIRFFQDLTPTTAL
jgi:hypothetical protein